MSPDAPKPNPNRPLGKLAILPPVAVAILLILAGPKLLEWLPRFLEPSHNAAYRIQDGAWRPLPPLPGNPEKLQVSAGGTVWVLVWRYGVGSELARLDGSRWRIFRGADFGVRGGLYASGFVLDGEDLWAPTEEGVLHWDTRGWKLYREANRKHTDTSMAASHGQVWLLDENGAFSHFDGSQWRELSAVLPGPKPSDDSGDSPELAATADGSLWLLWKGLWQWNGSRWTPVEPQGESLESADLVGVTRQSIWLWNGEGLEAVGSGGAVRKFAPEEMGFLPGEGIEDVAESGGRIDIATSRGILELDGSAWRRLPPPRNGVEAVAAIRHGARGELLAIGTIPHPVARRLRFLVRLFPLLWVLALLAMVVWMVRIYKRQRLTDHQRLQEAVEHATGAIPEEFVRDGRLLAKQSSWWSASMTVGVLIGALSGFQIARMFWPGVPSWMFLALALGLHLLATVVQTLVRRTPKPWDPIEPGGARFDWGPTRQALPASLAVFLLMNVGAFPKWMGDPVLWLLYGILALTWYKALEERLWIRAVRCSDYDGALRVVQRFRFYHPESGAALRRRGLILLLAGRFRQSEEMLRRAIAGLRSQVQQAHALELLGDALLEQGRQDEALRSFEAALRAAPGFRRPYRGMAELVLREGRDPGRALAYVENIAGPRGPSRNRWSMNGRSADDYWALKAWALAELGRGAEVDAAVAEALRKTNLRSGPDAAATYRRLGLAMQALDRQKEAEEYLQKAVEADPNGRWSAPARAALSQAGVWSA